MICLLVGVNILAMVAQYLKADVEVPKAARRGGAYHHNANSRDGTKMQGPDYFVERV